MTKKSNNSLNNLSPDNRTFANNQLFAVLSLLEADQFGEAVGILRVLAEARTHDELRENGLNHILSAAIQICLACSQCQQELEWHRQSQCEAQTRMEALDQQLKALLEQAIYEGEPRESSGARQPVVTPTSETIEQASASRDFEENRSLWQRFKSMFDLILARQPKESTSLAESPGLPITGDLSLAHSDQPPEPEQPAARVVPVAETKPAANSPSLSVYLLGTFRVFQDEQPLIEWPSSKGKAIFKYLVTNRKRPVPKEILMDIFWRETDPESARNNLNVAIYGLRQALRADYLSLLDWLSRYYVEQKETAACQIICCKMLAVEPCCEEAHRRLMRCYQSQGQPYLALRQYHTCVEIMKNELEAPPSPKTSELYRQILAGMGR